MRLGESVSPGKAWVWIWAPHPASFYAAGSLPGKREKEATTASLGADLVQAKGLNSTL